MTREEYRAAMNDAAYLAGCAVRRETPDARRVAAMELGRLYEAAQTHMLCAAVGMALETAGVGDERFVRAVALAQRKAALLEADSAAVREKLDEAGIWHMPLKGSVLKELYPRFGMREMADVDILFDAPRAGDVREIMEGLGFQTDSFGCFHDDAYTKLPVSHFEMHRTLFSEAAEPELHAYYADVRERLLPEEGSKYGLRFTDEDFYLYLIAHEYKHYTGGGTGLRSLLDVYVFLRAKSLDEAYVAREAERLGIADFERKNRSLAFRLFDGEELTPEQRERLDYMICSGTFGTAENNANIQIAEKGRWGYFLSWLHPSREIMMESFPVLREKPALTPVFRVWRLIRAFVSKDRDYRRQCRRARLRALLGLDGKNKS